MVRSPSETAPSFLVACNQSQKIVIDCRVLSALAGRADGTAARTSARAYAPTGASLITRRSTVTWCLQERNFRSDINRVFLSFFLGKKFDFHGNCEYMLAKGTGGEPLDKFQISIQVNDQSKSQIERCVIGRVVRACRAEVAAWRVPSPSRFVSAPTRKVSR